MYVVIWEFKVKPESESDFINLCGQNGEWVEWFRNSPDYIETDLLKSGNGENIYLTVDKWKSKVSYDQYYNSDPVSFNRLDQKGETYTTDERRIGDYETV